MLGKIVLESFDASTSGGIELNLGKMGAAGQIAIKAPLGDIEILSKGGPTGIKIEAKTTLDLIGTAFANLVGQMIEVGSGDTSLTQIEGEMITAGGSSEPALLGKAFTDLFKEHQHPSSVGPTGPIMPQYAAKIIKTMSQKVFLG
jgi:hypothetical protein